MELGPDNHTCQIQSYCAKHLKCSQKCDQNKFSVKCSCYEGWVLEPDGESCRSLGERQSRPRRGEQGGGRGGWQGGVVRRLNYRGRLRFPSGPSARAHGDPVCSWTGWLGGKK